MSRRSNSTGEIRRESGRSGQRSSRQVPEIDVDTESRQIRQDSHCQKAWDDLQLSRASLAGSLGCESKRHDFDDAAPRSSTRRSISTGEISRDIGRSRQQSFRQVAEIDLDTESTQIMRNGSWQKVRDDLRHSRASQSGSLGSERLSRATSQSSSQRNNRLSRSELAMKSDEESQEDLAQRIEQCRRDSGFAKAPVFDDLVSGFGRKSASEIPKVCRQQQVSDDDACSAPSLILQKDGSWLPSSEVLKSKIARSSRAQILGENDPASDATDVTMIWDETWRPARESPQQQRRLSRVEEQRAGDDQRRVSAKARQGSRLSLFARKSCTLDTSLPTEQHEFLVWGFDENGAHVHRIKGCAPPGLGICVGDRLVAINGERVLDKEKDQIKQIWCTCLDDGHLLHLDLVADDNFRASP